MSFSRIRDYILYSDRAKDTRLSDIDPHMKVLSQRLFWVVGYVLYMESTKYVHFLLKIP